MKNLISVSSAPIAGLDDKEYYDLLGTIDVMKKVLKEAVVDGFELQLEPEWERENAPLTDTDWADWTKTPKFSAEEIVELIKGDRHPRPQSLRPRIRIGIGRAVVADLVGEGDECRGLHDEDVVNLRIAISAKKNTVD